MNPRDLECERLIQEVKDFADRLAMEDDVRAGHVLNAWTRLKCARRFEVRNALEVEDRKRLESLRSA